MTVTEFIRPKTMREAEVALAQAIHAALQVVGPVGGTFAELPTAQQQWLLEDAQRLIAARVGVLDHDARTQAVAQAMDDEGVDVDDFDVFTCETARIVAHRALRNYDDALLKTYGRWKAAHERRTA